MCCRISCGATEPKKLARAVRDHVTIGGEEHPVPWALRMHFDCVQFNQFPRKGDWFDQDDHEFLAMRLAARSFEVYQKEKLTPEDAKLLEWIETDD